MSSKSALSVLLLGLTVFFLGCADVPFSEPTPSVSSAAPIQEVQNPSPVYTTLSGWVEIGAPVESARIRLHRFDNAEVGDVLAEGQTDAKGQYSLAVPTQPSGPCVLISEGGHYLDPITGGIIQMAQIRLRAPLTVLKANHQEISVNIWSTLAVRRLLATKKHYDSLEKAISANLLLMSQHLHRSAAPEAVLKTQPIDLTVKGLSLNDFNLRVHLSQLGLNRLARHHYHTSVQELINQLNAELSKGLFKDETTRSDLVVYLEDALSELKKQHELGFNQAGLNASGGFYSDIALDTNASLYPAELIPNPKPLEIPFLYDARVVDASTLSAFAPITATARLKFPAQVSMVEARLLQIKMSIDCENIKGTGLLAAMERAICRKEANPTILESQTLLEITGGQVRASFLGKPKDLKGEVFYKIQFEVRRIDGAKLLFETEKFCPVHEKQ